MKVLLEHPMKGNKMRASQSSTLLKPHFERLALILLTANVNYFRAVYQPRRELFYA